MKNNIQYYGNTLLVFLWGFMLSAQTVHWHSDESVEVKGGEMTFTSYVPSNFDDSLLMDHLDVNQLFDEFKGNILEWDGWWPKFATSDWEDWKYGYVTAVKAGSGNMEVTYKVYSYDPDNVDNGFKGSFLYGLKNLDRSPIKKSEATPFFPEHNDEVSVGGIFSSKNSLDIKHWFSKAKIPIPEMEDCQYTGMNQSERRLLNVVDDVETVTELFLLPEEVAFLARSERAAALARAGVARGGELVSEILFRLRKFRMARKGYYAVARSRVARSSDETGNEDNGEAHWNWFDFSGVTLLKYAIRKIYDGTGNNEKCIRYFSNFQPVIMELTVKNARVYNFKIQNIDIELSPSEIFNPDIPRESVPIIEHLFPDPLMNIGAHRGYWRKEGVAQNSKASLEAATHTDSDFVELDVRSTKDKVAICLHDDMPQQILKGTRDIAGNPSIYDLDYNQLKDYYLYDRHGNETDEKLLSLENAFKHISENNIDMAINLDIGIPAVVPQGGKKIDGQPFIDQAFIDAIKYAKQYNLLNRIIFKGKYTVDSPIWERIADEVMDTETYEQNGYTFYPKILYTPKFGADTASDSKGREKFLNDWLNFWKVKGLKYVKIVGFEVRLKDNQNNDANNQLLTAIDRIKEVRVADRNHEDEQETSLRVGVFSENPTTCQGYWSKSAIEKYIDFDVESRNNFFWLLNHGYDYIITDTPNIMHQARQKTKQFISTATDTNQND